MICGILFMKVRDLVDAVLSGDLLSARQWVADAQREGVTWESVPYPRELAGREMTVAAGLIELLAERAGKRPPPWTSSVGAERLPLVLDPGLEDMPRSFARAQAAGPEPLRKRNLFALPDFLHVA
jgi:hypothetical protein